MSWQSVTCLQVFPKYFCLSLIFLSFITAFSQHYLKQKTSQNSLRQIISLADSFSYLNSDFNCGCPIFVNIENKFRIIVFYYNVLRNFKRFWTFNTVSVSKCNKCLIRSSILVTSAKLLHYFLCFVEIQIDLLTI